MSERILKSIGLIKGERRGYRIHYTVDRGALEHCQDVMFKALTLKED